MFLVSIILLLLCTCKISAEDPPQLTGIQITTQPTKVFYVNGECLDLSGLVVSVIYDNGTIEPINDYTSSINHGDMLNVHGEQVITISYQGFSTYFTITVLKKLIDIKIQENPVKTKYYVGESIDFTGLKVIAQYSDASEEEITDYTSSISVGEVLKFHGEQTVTISYQSFSVDFTITVLKKLIDIKIQENPVKTKYYVGESIDFTGLKVIAQYSDASEEEITDYTSSISVGEVLKFHGEQTVTISYQSFSVDFTITVLKKLIDIKIQENPVKTKYYVGESIDFTGLKVIAQYSDDSEEEITDYTPSIASGTILSIAKTYTISVSYKGVSKNFNIECINNSASIVSVTLPEHQDIENLLTYDNGVFTAKNGFSSYTWWLDSTALSINTETYTLITKNLSDGYHNVMIVVKTSDDEMYSATAIVNIIREEI